MTVTNQLKILDRKIIQNEAQYDLDRKAAKISALSSNNLDKYEYLTGEDLGLKPSNIEQLIILQILIITILLEFTENAQENSILFRKLILRYQQVNL